MAGKNETTTKFKVDISELKSAMQTARKEVALANSEFKATSSSMNNWSKSTSGISAKLKQLKSNLSSQKTILSEYESTLEDVKAQYGENSREAMDYQTKLNNQKAVVNNLEREIDKYSNSLEIAEKAERIAAETGRDVAEVYDELASGADDASDSIDDAGNSAEKSSSGFTVMKGALADLVADGIRLAADALKDFASNMIDTAATVKAEQSKFSQTFGSMEKDASAAIKGIANSTGILDSRLKDTGANIYAFARSSGASTSEAMELMQTALKASADSAAYYDTSLEDAAETLQSFLKGNFANDAALGVSATEFTRNAKATELFGKKYNDLTEIQKQQTLLKMVTDAQELSGAMGQASREADGWENVQGNLNEAWRQFQANVGTPFLEALIPVIQKVTSSFKEWSDNVDWDAFNKKVKEVIENVKKVGSVISELSPVIVGLGVALAGLALAGMVQNISGIIGAMKTWAASTKLVTAAQWLLNAAQAASPITLIIIAVLALVAAFIVLWNKSEAFRNFWIGLWEDIKSTFDKVMDGIVKFFTETIPNTFNDVIEWIKKNWSSILLFLINPFAGLFKYFYDNNDKFKEFVDNAVKKIKEMPSKIWTWLLKTINKVVEFGTNLKEKGKEAAKKLYDSVSDKIGELPDKIKDIGKNIVTGLWSGISDKFDWLTGKIKKFASNVTDKLKDFFGIHSPSRVMRDEIGKWLPEGIAVGIDKNAKSVLSSMKDLTAQTVATARDGLGSATGNLSSGSSATGGVVNNFYQTNNSPKALSRLEIYRQSKNLLGYVGGN